MQARCRRFDPVYLHQIHMNNRSPTFCVAPWVHAAVKTDGKLYPCCQSHMKSRYLFTDIDQWWRSAELDQLRQDLDQGLQPPACQQCWTAEHAGGRSLRHIYNSEFEPLLRNDLDRPQTYDLKLGNLCNLRCVMCSGNSSSSIMTEYRTNRDRFDQLAQYQRPNIMDYSWPGSREFLQFIPALGSAKFIKFTGGEPFMNPYIQDVLDSIPDPAQVTLNLSTNATVVNDSLLRSLSRFRAVWLSFSVDALGDKFEYVRHGAGWQQVQANMQRFRTLDNAYFSLATTVQAITALSLGPLLEYAREHELTVTPIFLSSPGYMAVHSLPTAARDRALHSLEQQAPDLNDQARSAMVKFLQATTYDPDLNRQLTQYLDTLDQIRHTDHRAVFPELIDRG